MPRICTKCGGLLVGELVMDFYQVRHWKCINCGWYREEVFMHPARSISPARHHVRK